MGKDPVRLEADGILVEVNLRFGMIETLRVSRNGGEIDMLHRSPWHLQPEDLPDDAAPHLSRLTGDFFCAPFGDASIDSAPAHGWPANSPWTLLDLSRDGPTTTARFVLDRKILGAALVKEFRLIDGHPFLYQRHVFRGGDGTIPVSNHAMVALPAGGRCAFSPKRWFETPESALEPDPARGRSVLAYPARSDDPRQFPLANGGMADLTRYPLSDRNEDFVVSVEAPGRTLGWSAVHREPDGNVFLSLRNTGELPITMLWFSNGGRDYAPWNGQHTGVLGIEEGIVGSLLGASAMQRFTDADVPTTLKLDPKAEVEVRHIIGCAPFDPAATITDIAPDDDGVILTSDTAGPVTLPCDIGFLRL